MSGADRRERLVGGEQVFDVRFRCWSEVCQDGQREARHGSVLLSYHTPPQQQHHQHEGEWPAVTASSQTCDMSHVRRASLSATAWWATLGPATRCQSRGSATPGRWRLTTFTPSGCSTSAQSPGRTTGGPASEWQVRRETEPSHFVFPSAAPASTPPSRS